jgi:hypothetical protein
MTPSAEACTTTLVAVVQASDGVRFVAGGNTADEVAALLVDYISRRAAHVLWPLTASRVAELIDAGNVNAAIAEYFANVGSRWDEEQLHTYSTTRDLTTARVDLWKGDDERRAMRLIRPA